MPPSTGIVAPLTYAPAREGAYVNGATIPVDGGIVGLK